MGSNDNNIVVTFSNYGINNIWVTNNAGTNWTAIDGNLPDMPVRWAMFAPGNDQKLMIATEAGVFTTDLINGAATNWETSSSFPTVRTDMIRMRKSDNTVVAATHGRGLFTAQFFASTLPAVNFASAATTVTEDSVGLIGCRRYKDYTVNVGIINPATGNTTATFTVQSGNTAVQGVDFDITTNGSFTNASNQIIFPSGDATAAPVTFRIYDDAEVESTETFTLGFTLSGSNAIIGTQATHTFSITDNDRVPSIGGIVNANVGVYDGTNLGSDPNDPTTPFASQKRKHKIQYFFTAGELLSSGITSAALINSLTIRVKTKNSLLPFNGFTVSIGHTGYTGLNTGFVPESLQTVFSADYSSVAGNNTFNFSSPFVWDGIKSIVVQFCFDKPVAEALADEVEANAAPIGLYIPTVYSNFNNASISSAPGCSIPAARLDYGRINASFNSTLPGNSIATNLNTSLTEYLTSNNDLYYYSSAKEIIARVKNTSSQNYGCTQVLIDRAGSGSSQFFNYKPANYLMNKTYQIIPTTNNATGTSQVTFYYTKEEKEGWEAATGQLWNNIMLIKVPSKISNVTPLNPQPDGPGSITVVTPIRGTFGTGYTLTGTFANGFSGFGAGIPGRIITILTLSGAVDNTGDGQNINLTWTTSAEVSSTVFELEKSYDGITFHKIATVNAAGNKLSPSTYSFTDKEGLQINYYRVRLLHSDGTPPIVSNTIFINNENVRQRLIVLNNPFSNQLTVRLATLPSQSLKFGFYDMNGKLVKSYQAPGGAVIYTINTSTIVSKGIYRLRVYIGDEVFYSTLIKQ